MSCYFIAQISIHDQAEYDRYLEGFDAVFDDYAGRVVAVDEDPRCLEGECACSRIVMIRFPSEWEARRWYESSAYQELLKHRRKAAECNVVLVSGSD